MVQNQLLFVSGGALSRAIHTPAMDIRAIAKACAQYRYELRRKCNHMTTYYELN